MRVSEAPPGDGAAGSRSSSVQCERVAVEALAGTRPPSTAGVPRPQRVPLQHLAEVEASR